ncbi:unnamed protein product [Alopecurus aequalis]
MDDGRHMEAQAAQPGPINYSGDVPELQPWTWIETTAVCLCIVLSVGTIAGGIVTLLVRPARRFGDTTAFVAGSIIIAVGLFDIALMVFLLVTEFQSCRKVEAMTRLHMVPMSRP